MAKETGFRTPIDVHGHKVGSASSDQSDRFVAMNDNSPNALLHGQIAYREYEVILQTGETGLMVITLGDLGCLLPAATVARQAGAVNYGLFSIAGIDNAPKRPVIWLCTETHLHVMPAEEDPDLFPSLKRAVTEELFVFFHEMKRIAPELPRRLVANDGQNPPDHP